MSNPILNFVSIVGKQVSAMSVNFPDGARVVVVDKTSGETLSTPVTEASGSGPVAIALPGDFPLGDYYLKGLDKDGGYLAQSVEFYVN